MSEPGGSTTGGARPIEQRLRLSGALLMLGLLVEGATLFALDRPIGFLTFAGAGGLLVLAGIALYLWAIVSHA
jgi:hypothetical protein